MSIFQELKRRNVFKVAVAYIIVSWLILQVGDLLAPALHLPEWVTSALAFFVILGFPLAMVIAWAFEVTPEGLKLQKEVDRDKSITQVTGRKLNNWIIGLLAAAVIVFAFDRFVLAPERSAAEIEEAVQQARNVQNETSQFEGEPGPSIAVLPFVNMSNDPEQEFFSDGISEELLNVLARYPGLRVAARTSSFLFKEQNLDIAEIARQLRVNHVLEGSVRKAGDRIRITAQLIEAKNGYHLWSESFDRDLVDVFKIQDEISAAIGEALKITLDLDGQAAAIPTVIEANSLAAYEDYMAGRQLINQRGRANIERAVVLLESAVSEDPEYAPAHAQLAIAYLLLSGVSGGYGDWPFPEARLRAMPHIERALELDEFLPEAYGALTLAGIVEPDYAAAFTYSERALELNPNYADAHNWHAFAVINLGLYAETMESLENLLKVDPLSVIGRFNMSVALSRSGRVDEGISLANSLEIGSPNVWYHVRGLIAHDSRGDLVGATEWFLKLYDLTPGDTSANHYLAFIFGKLDLMPEALRLRDDMWFYAYQGNRNWQQVVIELERLLESDPDDKRRKIFLASALLYAGDYERAQVFYESLVADQPGTVLREPIWYSTVPALHAAWLRLMNDDEPGAIMLMDQARADLQAHDDAGREVDWHDRSAALLAAMEGDEAKALRYMELAFERGHRDLSLFDEPALAGLADDPSFQDLRRRMQAEMAKQRVAVLELICGNNTSFEHWRPLPETCAK